MIKNWFSNHPIFVTIADADISDKYLDHMLVKFEQKLYGKKLIFQLGIFVTIDDADIGSLKSLHSLFDKYFDHILVKFELFCGPNYTNFWAY